MQLKMGYKLLTCEGENLVKEKWGGKRGLLKLGTNCFQSARERAALAVRSGIYRNRQE